jgi:phenylalanyl-tRNA synthetase beta subunit
VYGVNVKSLKLEKSSKKYVHPTRSFDVKIRNKDGEQTIAIFGEISPVVLKDFEIKNPVCFFELFAIK